MLRTTSIPATIGALIALALAGCGSGAPHPGHSHSDPAGKRTAAATTTTTTTSTTSASAATGQHTSGSEPVASGPLAFAKCMRAHGVSNFPDPSPNGGFAFKTGSNVASSPAFQTAQTSCQRYMGGGPGFQGNPSKQTMDRLLRIARCMRAHGIHQFPDPLYNRPRHFTPGEYQEITDFDGATLLFPANMSLQAPAYRQALAACGAPPLGLPH